MNNTYVIGDIHGGLKALQALLNQAPIQKNDTLIFLGDYVDGWSESTAVVNFLMSLSTQYQCIFIKGNHDAKCEEWLATGVPSENWFRNGGQFTIEQYQALTIDERQIHLEWFKQLKLFYVDDQNRLFIHAGFSSIHGPEYEFNQPFFNWDRTLWEVAITMDKSIKSDTKLYPKRLKLFSEIYLGHTPTLYLDSTLPLNGCNVWNLDTGAAFTGPLTMMNVDTKVYWQSAPVHTYYPNERGRNKRK